MLYVIVQWIFLATPVARNEIPQNPIVLTHKRYATDTSKFPWYAIKAVIYEPVNTNPLRRIAFKGCTTRDRPHNNYPHRSHTGTHEIMLAR